MDLLIVQYMLHALCHIKHTFIVRSIPVQIIYLSIHVSTFTQYSVGTYMRTCTIHVCTWHMHIQLLLRANDLRQQQLYLTEVYCTRGLTKHLSTWCILGNDIQMSTTIYHLGGGGRGNTSQLCACIHYQSKQTHKHAHTQTCAHTRMHTWLGKPDRAELCWCDRASS